MVLTALGRPLQGLLVALGGYIVLFGGGQSLGSRLRSLVIATLGLSAAARLTARTHLVGSILIALLALFMAVPLTPDQTPLRLLQTCDGAAQPVDAVPLTPDQTPLRLTLDRAIAGVVALVAVGVVSRVPGVAGLGRDAAIGWRFALQGSPDLSSLTTLFVIGITAEAITGALAAGRE